MEFGEGEARIREALPGALLETPEAIGEPYLVVDAARIREVGRFLKEDGAFRFDYLTNLGGLDEGESLTVALHLRSTHHGGKLALRASVPRENPEIESLFPVWEGAGWFEREAFDLFGIRFLGHPDLRRIMLPDDWEGHPLRKDYVDPMRYGEIDNTRDYGIGLE
ncbi:MAG: NADH-quinone oxidoreductase subunit C [Candidatus Eisenbacteria bacterium]